jgi:hypothetical protein
MRPVSYWRTEGVSTNALSVDLGRNSLLHFRSEMTETMLPTQSCDGALKIVVASWPIFRA